MDEFTRLKKENDLYKKYIKGLCNDNEELFHKLNILEEDYENLKSKYNEVCKLNDNVRFKCNEMLKEKRVFASHLQNVWSQLHFLDYKIDNFIELNEELNVDEFNVYLSEKDDFIKVIDSLREVIRSIGEEKNVKLIIDSLDYIIIREVK